MGDFNDEPESLSLRLGAQARIGVEADPSPQRLYNLSRLALEIPTGRKARGTHVHRGHWGFLDQVLVTGSLLTGRFGLRLHQRPFVHVGGPLLYKGRPNRWYSDHLPMAVSLRPAESSR